MSVRLVVRTSIVLATALCAFGTQAQAFSLQETSIENIHSGIRAGEVTCKQIVEAYVARAKAYNGVCTKLVTADGAAAPAAVGTVRGGMAVKFPTETVAIAKLIPDFDKYKGLKPDYGRMEPTMSDPSVQNQYGMVAGIPNAKQVNGLDTINLRGERQILCPYLYSASKDRVPFSFQAVQEP